YHNDRAVTTVADSEKTFAVMGERLIVFPDKICFHFAALDVFDSVEALEAAVTAPTYGDIYAVGTALPRDLCYWNGSEWQFLEKECTSLEATYRGEATFLAEGEIYGEKATANTVRVVGTNLKKLFDPGDGIVIRGCGEAKNNVSAIIREVGEDTLRFYEDTFLAEEDVAEEDVTIAREVPDMDHICAVNNRLWGCKGDTVYCSKLGDPYNFNVFDSLSTDSYSVESGSAGEFTACCGYLGYPHFFKEDRVFKVYGTKPADYSLVTSVTSGVAKNSHKSLAVVGENLFYLSPFGVMCYGGGVPVSVHDGIGCRCFDGVGGGFGEKYYLKAREENGRESLFVYDTSRGMWHREDGGGFTDFRREKGNFCGVTDEGDVYCLVGDAEGESEKVSWYARFGRFIQNSPDKKTVSKVLLRLEMDKDAEARVYIACDGGEEHPMGPILSGAALGTRILPIVPARCDHFRLTIRGKGGCRIHGITVEYTLGTAL
ncbi:MAG: hypothetical protein IIY02_03790, partial [Firmicutes bacterium]|nr:hypothetical protein [Bacillota bacterium]